MRYAAIILGIIAASFLVPQNAFARGGSQKNKSDRRKPKVEVVTEPVVVTKHRRAPVVVKPVIVEKARRETVKVDRATLRSHHQARHEVRRESRRPHRKSHGRSHRDARRGDARHGDHRHHAHCGWIEGHYERVARKIVVPGFFRKEYVAARYAERRGPRGIRFFVQIHPAGWRNVWVSPTTQVRYDHVWIAGHYACGR